MTIVRMYAFMDAFAGGFEASHVAESIVVLNNVRYMCADILCSCNSIVCCVVEFSACQCSKKAEALKGNT